MFEFAYPFTLSVCYYIKLPLCGAKVNGSSKLLPENSLYVVATLILKSLLIKENIFSVVWGFGRPTLDCILRLNYDFRGNIMEERKTNSVKLGLFLMDSALIKYPKYIQKSLITNFPLATEA